MINKGDIATSATFGLSGRQLPFRKVTDSVINRNGIHLIRLEGDVNFSVASDFKVADTNDFIQYEELKTRVKYLENSNDENQHISSITKEPKVQLKNEEQAFKATAVKINGQWIEIFKDPKTDNSGKKSAKGLLKVYWQDAGTKNSKIVLQDQCSEEQEIEGLLKTIFENGSFIKRTSLTEIRERISNSF